MYQAGVIAAAGGGNVGAIACAAIGSAKSFDCSPPRSNASAPAKSAAASSATPPIQLRGKFRRSLGLTILPWRKRVSIRRLRRLHQGGARSPLDPPTELRQA